MNARRANLLTAAALAVLLALVALTAPRWTRLLSRPLPGSEEDAARRRGGQEAAGDVERQIGVKLFFQSKDGPGLVIEERSVAFASDLGIQLRAVMQELVTGSKSGLAPTLAPATRVLDVFVSPRGVAYVDLSREAAQTAPGGSESELITVYSIVNTLTASFPAVKRVHILLDDRPTSTLAGHVDLTRPLSPDMTLLAASPLTPVGGGPGAP